MVIVFQAVKEIAKELFVEVIDEMATQLSTNFLDLIRMLTTEANDILHDIINDTNQSLLRYVMLHTGSKGTTCRIMMSQSQLESIDGNWIHPEGEIVSGQGTRRVI